MAWPDRACAVATYLRLQVVKEGTGLQHLHNLPFERIEMVEELITCHVCCRSSCHRFGHPRDESLDGGSTAGCLMVKQSKVQPSDLASLQFAHSPIMSIAVPTQTVTISIH